MILKNIIDNTLNETINGYFKIPENNKQKIAKEFIQRLHNSNNISISFIDRNDYKDFTNTYLGGPAEAQKIILSEIKKLTINDVGKEIKKGKRSNIGTSKGIMDHSTEYDQNNPLDNVGIEFIKDLTIGKISFKDFYIKIVCNVNFSNVDEFNVISFHANPMNLAQIEKEQREKKVKETTGRILSSPIKKEEKPIEPEKEVLKVVKKKTSTTPREKKYIGKDGIKKTGTDIKLMYNYSDKSKEVIINNYPEDVLNQIIKGAA